MKKKQAKSPWMELSMLCSQIHNLMHVKTDKYSAIKLLPQLQSLLKAIPKDSGAILEHEALALESELSNNLPRAIRHRRKEITLTRRLHQNLKRNHADSKTTAYALQGRGEKELDDRVQILKTLLKSQMPSK